MSNPLAIRWGSKGEGFNLRDHSSAVVSTRSGQTTAQATCMCSKRGVLSTWSLVGPVPTLASWIQRRGADPQRGVNENKGVSYMLKTFVTCLDYAHELRCPNENWQPPK